MANYPVVTAADFEEVVQITQMLAETIPRAPIRAAQLNRRKEVIDNLPAVSEADLDTFNQKGPVTLFCPRIILR